MHADKCIKGMFLLQEALPFEQSSVWHKLLLGRTLKDQRRRVGERSAGQFLLSNGRFHQVGVGVSLIDAPI